MAKDDSTSNTGGADDKKQADDKTQQDAGATVQVKLDPIELLKADHRRVEQLFQQFESADESRKDEIVRQVCQELTIHTLLEEEIFYPACREAADDEAPLNEAQVEHDAAKMLIMDLMSGRADDPFRDAKVKVLAEEIKHHVGEEEAPTKGIFAKAKAAGLATPELADELQSRKQELQAQGRLTARVRLVALRQPSQSQAPQGRTQEDDMAYQDRDERGRFTSDDDDRRGGRSYSARSSGGGGRSYRDDDDDRGWYGDSRGHSEAARRGWETRRGESRSFRDDDDDDRRSYRGADRDRDERGRFVSDDDDRRYASSRGRYSDDDRDRGRGRYSDDDDRGGYRSSSGRYRDDDDGRGWYGDSRGHAEAARKGWQTRRDEDDDRGRYRSRGRDYGRDDGRDRGQGGWFGDSRGHAEAARRGWENRR